ncbi:hypothetical protein BC831DRAFT_461738 [Entophlyctis helioformis]|nr:hypothetical protein BC831DRAFT_461738 [Entophlyctis helioformis]
MADAGLTSPAGDSVSSASDSSGSPDSSLPIGPRSKASMRQNNTLGGIGNSRAASNTNTRSALHLALAALARPLAGLSATDTNASPSTSSSSSSPSSSSISSLPSLLPGSQSPDLLHSITAQTDCAPCQQNQQSHDAVSAASTIAAARRTGNQMPRQATIQSLPNELLHDILALLKPHQASLWEASKVCHKWNAVATRILYKEAHVGSPAAISKFTALLAHSVVSNRTSVPYYRIVRKIVFEPCLQGSLDHQGHSPQSKALKTSVQSTAVSAAGDVPAPPAHSETSIPVPDSIFYLLSGLCTSLKEMEEQGVESSPASLSGSWKPIQPASTTLTLLIRACRRWLIGLPEWGGFGLSVDKAYLTIILLLESFEGEFRPSISTALLLQVQFVTCWQSWRGVRQMRVGRRRRDLALQPIGRRFLVWLRSWWTARREHQHGRQRRRARSTTATTATMSSILPYFSTDRSDEDDSVSQVECCFLTLQTIETMQSLDLQHPRAKVKQRNSKKRCRIAAQHIASMRPGDPVPASLPASPSREAPPRLPPPVSATISISPHRPSLLIFIGSASSSAASPIPAEPVLAALPISTLRDALLTFPPTSINGEMVEHLHRITEMDYDLREPGGTELKLWVSWLNETIRWHTASKQMDPVKDLLRGSMHKIDQLRGVQRRYGLSFMD